MRKCARFLLITGIICVCLTGCGNYANAKHDSAEIAMENETNENTVEDITEDTAADNMKNDIEDVAETEDKTKNTSKNTAENTAEAEGETENKSENTEKTENNTDKQDNDNEGIELTDETGFTTDIVKMLDNFIAPDTRGETGTFEDFDKVLNSNFLGLWYDPELGEAIWLKDEGAYVYIPYLNMYGDQLYEWEIIDRKQDGKCPKLAIYFGGKTSGPLAYYVGGITDEYFWCVSQGQILYKVNVP